MSVWTTKSLDNEKEYIVIKHYLPGINGKIHGVTFRGSYGVVEKGSKIYFGLKRMPVFKNAMELPLFHLQKLPFITRSQDIMQVYGKEVYTKYLKALDEERLRVKLAKEQEAVLEDQKRREELEAATKLKEELKEAEQMEDDERVEELQADIPQIQKCCYETKHKKLCKFEAFELSPSGYCKMHLLNDPKLEEFEIKIPMAMTKSERKRVKKRVTNKLTQLKKKGAF